MVCCTVYSFVTPSVFVAPVNLRQPLSTGWTRRCALVPSLHSRWEVQQLTAGQSVFLTQLATSLTSLFLCVEASQRMLKYPKVH